MVRIELKNLKIGKQDPTLFEIPAGYAKMEMPSFGDIQNMMKEQQTMQEEAERKAAAKEAAEAEGGRQGGGSREAEHRARLHGDGTLLLGAAAGGGHARRAPWTWASTRRRSSRASWAGDAAGSPRWADPLNRIARLVFLAGLLAVPQAAPAGGRPDPFPGVAASYLLKIDGKAVWEHLPDRRLPPASLTKIMTALLALESGRLGEVTTVSRAASRETGTRLGLAAGRADPRRRAAGGDPARLGERRRPRAGRAHGRDGRAVRAADERPGRGPRDAGHPLRQRDGPPPPGPLLDGERPRRPRRGGARGRTLRAARRDGTAGRPDRGRRAARFRWRTGTRWWGGTRESSASRAGTPAEAGPCLAVSAVRGETRVLLVLLNAPNRWWDAVAMLDNAFSLSAAVPAR